MRSLAAAAPLVIAFAATPALATGSIECASQGGEATVELTIGSLPVLAVVNAGIAAGEERWVLGGEGAEAVVVGQAFGDDDEMRIDFTDPNVERVVAEVRLFRVSEGDDMATAGTLRIAGTGAWAISCIGP